jgi:hypothetical protein
MSATTESLPERVAAGSGFLDEAYGPDWPERINLYRLNLNSCSRCILGQLEGDYAVAIEQLGITQDEAVARGFDVASADYHGSFGSAVMADLTALWREQIEGRRAA